MSWIIENWKIILAVIVVLAVIGVMFDSQEYKRLLDEWNELIAKKKKFDIEQDEIYDKRRNEDSEPERAKFRLDYYNSRLGENKNNLEIAKLRIEIIKKDLDEEKRERFINHRGEADYAIKWKDLDFAESAYKSYLDIVKSAEENVQEQEKENLFYQCKKCNEPYARERISNMWLNIDYLGSRCELENEDGDEQTIDDTESITKKEEQKGTSRRYEIEMHKIYQCKCCNDKTDEIQDNTVSGDFWCCPECAKDDVIKEIQTTELGQYKAYKEVVEENSRGKNTKQVSITKIREKTDYKCSNCGYEFSRINGRELK